MWRCARRIEGLLGILYSCSGSPNAVAAHMFLSRGVWYGVPTGQHILAGKAAVTAATGALLISCYCSVHFWGALSADCKTLMSLNLAC
jgi:hypothetical protein